MLARKLLLLGHYALQTLAMWLLVWRPGRRRGASRARRLFACALWFAGCSLAAGAIEPMFLFNHVATGRNPSLKPNDKIAQVCHTINYVLRWPRWLPVDDTEPRTQGPQLPVQSQCTVLKHSAPLKLLHCARATGRRVLHPGVVPHRAVSTQRLEPWTTALLHHVLHSAH